MKAKSIFQCAALLTGLLFLNVPLFAAVESDIVGYTTITMEAGKWYQIGIPFASLDGTTEAEINAVFNQGFVDGDSLYIFNPDTLAYTAYDWNSAVGESGAWVKPRKPTVATTATVKAGQGVYICKAETASFTCQGSVKVATEIEFGKTEGSGWNQITVLFPETGDLNGFKWQGLKSGDSIYIFNPETLTYTAYEWNETLNNTITNQAGAWVKPRKPNVFVNIPVSAGQAYYINKISAGVGKVSAE